MRPDPQPPRPGPTNSLIDIPGIRVGHHQRTGDGWLTGTTVVLPPDGGATAGVDVRGGGPGTRETDLLDPRNMVEKVHAVTLTGGSAFGLAAADGVMSSRYAEGQGFPIGGPGQVVPIVPGAVIFDLGRGGDFTHHPDADFGTLATAAAAAHAPALGNVGAGTGAQAGGLKGGVGSASVVLSDGSLVAALVIVNPVGSTVDPATGELWGARNLLPGDLHLPGHEPWQLATPDRGELAAAQAAAVEAMTADGQPRTLATTIGVIATDVTLTKAQCAKVSGIGHDGLARAIDPVHTMADGDTLFTLATGSRSAPDPRLFHELLTLASGCVTRAVVRAMLAAESVTTPAGSWRSYRDAFPSAIASATAGPSSTSTRVQEH